MRQGKEELCSAENRLSKKLEGFPDMLRTAAAVVYGVFRLEVITRENKSAFF